ncbi:MAG: hypothetical protein F4Y87_05095 [Synechococcus sp. SB0665_bin_28]|nr:hypothetical protein [Synechococcus sp. SB0665_bin_28]MYF20390.1 hypothetical protein [Synechococcus sp. SB0677_bin_5]
MVPSALLTGGLTVLLGALAVIWAGIKASEASEARQREDMRELRAKVDRLMEGLLAAKGPGRHSRTSGRA